MSVRPSKRIGRAALVALACAVPIAVRAAVDGRATYARAQQTEQPDLRIERLGRAARWRSPGLSFDDRARAELLRLGQDARSQGVDGEQQALAAFREARRAMAGAPGWAGPYSQEWKQASKAVADLMADQAERAPAVAPSLHPHDVRARLLEPPGPRVLPAAGAGLCMVGWLVACVGFVTSAISPDGRLRRVPATRWGVCAIAMLAAWCVLLWVA